MSIEIKIDCDGLGCCEEFTDGSDPEYIVEMAVDGEGWAEKNGFHFCASCSDAIEKQTEKKNGQKGLKKWKR